MYTFTDEKKLAIINAIRDSASIPEACKKAGVSVDTFRHWIAKAKNGTAKYVEFRKEVEAAKALNPQIGNKAWDRRLKYKVTYKGVSGSLAEVAKKFKVSYSLAHNRYLKHMSDPASYPLSWVFRPVSRIQDSMDEIALQRDVAKNLASIAESLSRIAEFCDRE